MLLLTEFKIILSVVRTIFNNRSYFLFPCNKMTVFCWNRLAGSTCLTKTSNTSTRDSWQNDGQQRRMGSVLDAGSRERNLPGSRVRLQHGDKYNMGLPIVQHLLVLKVFFLHIITFSS